LVGHSDADVLLHAITDGLLGAVAAGDIGRLFPNTDPANKNRDSAEFLREAYVRVQQAGWQLGNLDCVISAEEPKLAPHIETMRQSIANLLDVSIDRISLKGKTGEQVGPVGRQEAIEARCVVLLFAT
jgi:2-C-methyl-D-erythritol 2,4-cyclodiphosphate synthase